MAKGAPKLCITKLVIWCSTFRSFKCRGRKVHCILNHLFFVKGAVGRRKGTQSYFLASPEQAGKDEGSLLGLQSTRSVLHPPIPSELESSCEKIVENILILFFVSLNGF